MRPEVTGGWLSVPCDADDFAVVHIAVGEHPEDADWQAAFRDNDGRGRRTAAIPFRSEFTGQQVWLRVDGITTRLGVIRT
jgi:hypothetical protein